MTRPVPVLSASDAARLVRDGATVTVSSSSGLGCPDAVLRALGERFAAEGAPRDLTTLHPIAAGDMYGIDGIDHLCAPGQLRRVIAGSYPSGPSTATPPKIISLIESDGVEAYNIPSGILFQLHRAAAVGQPGVLTDVGVDTFVDPRRNGGRMNRRTTQDIVEVVDFDGREWLYLRSIPVDVAIIRATTADEFGNLTTEDEGAPLGILDQALAAHNNGGIVIAQVKRRARGRTLPAQEVRVPGILVDAVVVDPDQLQTTQTRLLPEAAGHYRAPTSDLELAEWGPEKVIARRAAQELRDGEAVNLGFGVSALVPRILLEEGLDGAVTWVIEQGAVGGIPFLGFAFGCAQNPDALMASPDQFTYLQGGGFDRALLSFLEVDAAGNVNVSRLATRPHVTAGVGGFIDITARAKNLVFSGYFTAGARIAIEDGHVVIEKEGRFPRFVPEVQHVTFSGRRALERGQHVTFVTERCVIRLLPEGLTVTEVAAGISITRDIVGQTALDLRISPDLRPMDPRLFRPEPLGLALAGGRPMSDLVLLAIDGPVATVTLNRAEKRNAIAPAMLAAFDAILSEVEASDAIRVLVVTGAGDRAFCAGADITAWSELAPIDMWRRWIPAGQRVLDHLEALRQPTIAAINGFAFGGGLELALACDLRIASDHATFASPEVGIATVPGWGATGRLAAVAGPARAKQLILTGQPIDARTAAMWGLVGEVVPAAELAERTLTLAMQVAGQAPIAVQVAKQLIDAQRPRPAVALEALGGGLTAFTTDAGEGRAAFRERRRPDFGGS